VGSDTENSAVDDVPPRDVLMSIINGLATHVKEHNFPGQCHAALKGIVPLVHALSTTKLTFGIKLSGSSGKALQSILLIAGAVQLDEDAFDKCNRTPGTSWFSFINAVKATNDVVKRISTKSFVDYLNSINLR
jgi:hypothetical protein